MAGDSFGWPACGPARHVRKGMPSAMDGYVEKCTHSSRRIRSRSGAVKGEGAVQLGCSLRQLYHSAMAPARSGGAPPFTNTRCLAPRLSRVLEWAQVVVGRG